MDWKNLKGPSFPCRQHTGQAGEDSLLLRSCKVHISSPRSTIAFPALSISAIHARGGIDRWDVGRMDSYLANRQEATPELLFFAENERDEYDCDYDESEDHNSMG